MYYHNCTLSLTHLSTPQYENDIKIILQPRKRAKANTVRRVRNHAKLPLKETKQPQRLYVKCTHKNAFLALATYFA